METIEMEMKIYLGNSIFESANNRFNRESSCCYFLKKLQYFLTAYLHIHVILCDSFCHLIINKYIMFTLGLLDIFFIVYFTLYVYLLYYILLYFIFTIFTLLFYWLFLYCSFPVYPVFVTFLIDVWELIPFLPVPAWFCTNVQWEQTETCAATVRETGSLLYVL